MPIDREVSTLSPGSTVWAADMGTDGQGWDPPSAAPGTHGPHSINRSATSKLLFLPNSSSLTPVRNSHSTSGVSGGTLIQDPLAPTPTILPLLPCSDPSGGPALAEGIRRV